MRTFCTLVLLLAAALLPARAAEISLFTNDGTRFLIVRGRLENDDGRKFALLAREIKKGVVVLESGGGSLLAGIEIGRVIRRKGLATWVSSLQGPCMSACGFAWLAGSPRMMDSNAKVGFHAAYTVEQGKNLVTGAGNALVGAFMRDLGLGDNVIIYATSERPESMRWLTRQDATDIGLAVAYVDEVRASTNFQDLSRYSVPIPRSRPKVREETSAWIHAAGYFFVGADTMEGGTYAPTNDECGTMCLKDAECVAFSFSFLTGQCYLKRVVDVAIKRTEFSSGYRPETPIAFRQ